VTQTFRRLHRTATFFALVAVYVPSRISPFAQNHASAASHHAPPFREVIPTAAKSDGYSLRWVHSPPEGRAATVQVSGLSLATLRALQNPTWKLADWRRVLAVHAEQGGFATSPNLPPMLGLYRVHAGLIIFQPQFSLAPGVAYRAEFRPGQLPGARSPKEVAITAEFKLPAIRLGPGTVVQQIFPTSSILPENLLKFYVHFSAPMSRGGIYERIHLRNDAGKEIELPFLEIDEELWDPTMTRLTLFIDPGRIKRGVLPLEEIGPALETGKSYSLVIDSGWKDGVGNTLETSFEKRFQVAAPDRDPPDPSRWKIQAPQPGTRAPFVVTFPEPMDHALAQRVIQIVTKSGEVLSGDVTLSDQERKWVFVPTNPWLSGSFTLVVPTTLEDLAGNNIGKLFEVDLFEGVQRRLATPTVKLPFEVH
jgi:hypothetical protein